MAERRQLPSKEPPEGECLTLSTDLNDHNDSTDITTTETISLSQHSATERIPHRFRSPPRTIGANNNNKSLPSISTSSDEVTAVVAVREQRQSQHSIRPPTKPNAQQRAASESGNNNVIPSSWDSAQQLQLTSPPIKSPSLEPPANIGPHRVAIQELRNLRPAFSTLGHAPSGISALNLGSERDLTSDGSSRDSRDALSDKSSAVSLTADERDLLHRLEKQNILLAASKGSSFRLPSRRSSSINSTAVIATGRAEQEITEIQTLIDKHDKETGGSGEDVDWEFWGSLLQDFDMVVRKNGKLLVKRIQSGLPGNLRGAIWSAFVHNNPASFWKRLQQQQQTESADSLNSDPLGRFQPPKALRQLHLDDAFVELLKIPSPHEKMIVRDLARTFPKHEFFKNAEGAGQESLFNVMKAYSLYDPEVGYCQGLSFIAGALLLNMPDEQAFECLVHLMHTYHLRGLFTPKMELLQLRLYQFDRLLQEILPRLHEHLAEQGIRSTMYASQWFLTIFAYRFPLEFVYRVLDIILATGVVYGASGSENSMMDAVFERVSEVASGSAGTRMAEIGNEASLIIFRFALALLKKNQNMILALDFEALLEFLKHGLFEIYLSNHEEQSGSASEIPTATAAAADDGGGLKQQSSAEEKNARPVSASGRVHVPRQAMDDLVRDATSPQFKSVNRKRLAQLRKDYEEELRQTDHEYLAEKSLEGQNQRLLGDLKRSEKALADLSRDHCDLAGQMVTLRLDLAKEREISATLRKQAADLKAILGQRLSSFDTADLKNLVKYEVTSENSNGPLPSVQARLDARLPTLEEQVQILTKQNLNLMEELAEWRTKAENLEHSNSHPQTQKTGWRLFNQ